MAFHEKLLNAIHQLDYTLTSELLRQTTSDNPQITPDQYQYIVTQACKDGQLEFIQLLVETFHGRYKPTVEHLHSAIKTGSLSIVKCLIIEGGCKPTDKHLDTAIKAQHIRLDIVKFLIVYECRPTIEHLDTVIQRGHLDTVKCLVVDGGCKPTNEHLNTAVQEKYSDIVKYLMIECGCKPTIKHLDTAIQSFDIVKHLVIDGGCKPTNKHLTTAIQAGRFYIVNWLVVDCRCMPTTEHLDIAIQRKHFDIVKCLVINGGCKPTNEHFNIAIQARDFYAVSWLVVDCRCKPTTKHLDIAIQRGHFDIVKCLVIDGGCKPTNKHLSTAIQAGDFYIVKCLVVDGGCKPTTEHLNTAIQWGCFDIVKYLVIDGECKPTNENLKTAIQAGRFYIVNWLVVDCRCMPTTEHIDIAIQWGCFDIMKYLLADCGCKPMVEHLYTVVEWKHFDIVEYSTTTLVEIAKFLIASENIDLNCRVGPNQCTVLHVACANGQLGVVKCLIKEGRCNIREIDGEGNTALHLACHYNHYHIVKALLDTGKCDTSIQNLDNSAPLDLADDLYVIRELIKYGASPSNVYKQFGSVLRDSPRQPIEAPVKVFVTGDPSGGKSTLTKSLQKEASTFARVFSRTKKVSDVDEKTAGIIPYQFESKQYGSVTFYDLAGQREFYSSHAAVLSNTICSSPPIFLLVIDLQRSEEELKQSILYWLSFLENQCSSVKGKPHVIIIGSHADILKSRGENPKQKVSIVNTTVGQLGSTWFEFAGFIPMDCQYPQSSEIDGLRHQLSVSCRTLRVTSNIQFNCHCLLVYLVDKFSNSLPVTLQQVKEKMLLDSSKKSPTKFIPLNTEVILSMCKQLYERGHILFLRNETNVEDSWVIIDKESLLSEVTGTVFAPEDFKQHCKLASSTGVVPLSEIVNLFPKHNSDMLISFFTHLEYCREICDQETLQLIEEHQSLTTSTDSLRVGEVNSNNTQSSKERYFLFSGLVTIERPDRVWNTDSQFSIKCGWMLQCSLPTQFFSSRFLQVLLLRIAFTFALAPHKEELDPSVPALQRKCSIWRNGIFWGGRNGVEVLVEVVEHKTVIVLMQSQQLTGECLQLRSSIISKVLKTAVDICPKVSTTESFINPSETLQYPIDSASELTCFSISEVAASVCSGETAVVSTTGKSLPLEILLTFEPYTKASLLIIHKLFDKTKEEEEVTDEFLNDFACANHEIGPDDLTFFMKCLNVKRGDFMHCVNQEPREYRKNPVHRCFLLLQTWKDQTAHPTLQALRRVLDQHSVFGGRNPMELAGVGFSHSDTLCEVENGGQETEEEVTEPQVKEEDRLSGKEEAEEEMKKPREVVHYKPLDRDSNSDTEGHSSSTDDQIHFCSIQHSTSSQFFVLNDLGFLMESLCQAAPQWYYIGLQLGVHPTDLDNISHNHSLFLDGPKSYLREMLKTWLCLASPQAGSLPALLSALKSKTVRESGLAKSVERDSMEYLERKTSTLHVQYQEQSKEDVQNKPQEKRVAGEEVTVEEKVEQRMKVEEDEEKRPKVEEEQDREEMEEDEEKEAVEEEEEEGKEEEEEKKDVRVKLQERGVEYKEEVEEEGEGGGEEKGKGLNRRKEQRREKSQAQQSYGAENVIWHYVPDLSCQGLGEEFKPQESYHSNASSHTQVVGLCARALYDYQAVCADDISFDVNDIIENIEQKYEEWWMGEINGERGLFPANHVELI